MSTTITFLPVKFETPQVLGSTDILSSISAAQARPSSSPCLCAISRPLCAVTIFESGSRSLVVIGDAELSQLIRAPRGVPVVPVSAYGMFCRLQWARVCVGGTGKLADGVVDMDAVGVLCTGLGYRRIAVL